MFLNWGQPVYFTAKEPPITGQERFEVSVYDYMEEQPLHFGVADLAKLPKLSSEIPKEWKQPLCSWFMFCISFV